MINIDPNPILTNQVSADTHTMNSFTVDSDQIAAILNQESYEMDTYYNNQDNNQGNNHIIININTNTNTNTNCR